MNFFLFDFVIASGDSMSPAIQSGSLLLVNRLEYGIRLPWRDRYILRWKTPKEGDVVIFYTPLGNKAVKRVGGFAEDGDFIALGDNRLVSMDSRNYGPVKTDTVIGKVLGIR